MDLYTILFNIFIYKKNISVLYEIKYKILPMPKKYLNKVNSSVNIRKFNKNQDYYIKKTKLPDVINQTKHDELDSTKNYPKITNIVTTVQLHVVVILQRLALKYPHIGKGDKFPSAISYILGGTCLISGTGSLVTPGCKTESGAKILAHLTRLMIEEIEQPVLIEYPNGVRKVELKKLRGHTSFDNFRVVNIVGHGRSSVQDVNKGNDYDETTFFPGKDYIFTSNDADFIETKVAFVTRFKTGMNVSMATKKKEDTYKAYQIVTGKSSKIITDDLHKKNKKTNVENKDKFIENEEDILKICEYLENFSSI